MWEHGKKQTKYLLFIVLTKLKPLELKNEANKQSAKNCSSPNGHLRHDPTASQS